MSKDKEIDKKGRRGALESLRDLMRGKEGEGLKKVTVAAPDTESLKAGLDMAKEKVDELDEKHEDHEHDEDSEKKSSDLDDKSREELIEMINDLK